MNAQQIKGQWNSIKGKLKERWGQLTNEDLTMAEGDIDQVIGTIQQKTGESREAIENYLDELTSGSTYEQAKEYTQQAAERAREGYEQFREQARRGYEQVRGQARETYGRAQQVVQDYPGTSLGVVFGLGLLTGVVVGLMVWSDE